MVEKEIESLHSDHSVASGREVSHFTVHYVQFLVRTWCFHPVFVQWVTMLKRLVFSLLVAEMVPKIATSLDLRIV